jgi:hypothetical protein
MVGRRAAMPCLRSAASDLRDRLPVCASMHRRSVLKPKDELCRHRQDENQGDDPEGDDPTRRARRRLSSWPDRRPVVCGGFVGLISHGLPVSW